MEGGFFMTYFSTHNHSCYSNLRLRDATNKIETLIDYCFDIGLSGLVFTEHECLGSHVKAYKYWKKNKDKFADFQVSFGNEIYLVDRLDTLFKKDNNERIEFFHFILIAKNKNGYEALKKLSSKAWNNSFFYRGIERVPTYKDTLEKIMEEYKGDLIATSACIGGEVPKLLIEYKRNPSLENKKKIHNLVTWIKKLFGDDFYFELQPAHNDEQTIANEMMLKIGKAYGIKCIVSTDAHYLNKLQAKIHKLYKYF
jgi:DNA polymerase-3 subunit alpha